ncbi:MAG: hypothetical protein WC689_10655 [Methylocystis sp.]|jgi:hypothetical protein
MGLLLMKTFNRPAGGKRDRRAAAPRAGAMLAILRIGVFLGKTTVFYQIARIGDSALVQLDQINIAKC